MTLQSQHFIMPFRITFVEGERQVCVSLSVRNKRERENETERENERARERGRAYHGFCLSLILLIKGAIKGFMDPPYGCNTNQNYISFITYFGGFSPLPHRIYLPKT